MGKSRMIFHELGGDKDEWEAFEDEVHIIGWESFFHFSPLQPKGLTPLGIFC
jgi:hypothetical protein